MLYKSLLRSKIGQPAKGEQRILPRHKSVGRQGFSFDGGAIACPTEEILSIGPNKSSRAEGDRQRQLAARMGAVRPSEPGADLRTPAVAGSLAGRVVGKLVLGLWILTGDIGTSASRILVVCQRSSLLVASRRVFERGNWECLAAIPVGRRLAARPTAGGAKIERFRVRSGARDANAQN
jgi:hypothetical protein